MKFKDKKVLVFGSGISGVSAAALLLQEGAEVVLYDGNDRLDAAGIKEQIEGQAKGSVSVVLGAFPEALLSELSLVVMSPGVPTDLPSVNQMRDAGIPIWGEIELAYVLAGHMVKEDIFSKMTDLLDSSIRWGLKTMMGVVLGFHLLQNLVTPYADALKNTSLQRFVSVIPGLGQGAAAVSQMVMGTGVLIKNSIGAGAVIILVLISAIPLLKLVILCLFYQGAAALLQPVCDKRMVACISEVGNGCRLLLSMAGAALLLFGVSLAIICTAANATYFAG